MTALNRLPIVVIAICEAVMIYTATGVAKVAFTQLDAVYAAWYRVGFMALMLLAWRKPWKADRRDSLPGTRRDWALLAGFGAALVLMNTMYYVAISNMDIGIATAIEFIGPLGVAVITGHSWRERVGIGIAACGVVLLAGISLGGENGGSFLIGLIAILIGGSMWGCYIVLGGKVATKGHPHAVLGYRAWLADAVGVPGSGRHRPSGQAQGRRDLGARLVGRCGVAGIAVPGVAVRFVPAVSDRSGGDATHSVRTLFRGAVHQSRHGHVHRPRFR